MSELEFSRRLRQYRKDRNLTQQELADRLGVSNKSVSRWEGGSYPDVALLGPLAAALGVTVDDLLNEGTPVRTLTRTDWQNVLSFAFALGGGILYFGLSTFMPVFAAYLLYVAALAYGVYLQRHYTYHSRWFYLSGLLMNFFVHYQLIQGIGVLVQSAYSYAVLQGFFGETTVSAEPFQFLIYALFAPAVRIGGGIALTAITALVIFCSGRRSRRRAEPEREKTPPTPESEAESDK